MGEVQRLQFLKQIGSRGNSPSLLAVGIEAVPIAALVHGNTVAANSAPPDCTLSNWKVGGEGRAGYVCSGEIFGQKRSRGNSWQWEWRLAPC